MIINNDREYLDTIRGLSITRVVLVHLGLSWFFLPYSDYVHVFLPLLFFVSGAVSYNSYAKDQQAFKYLVKRFIAISIPYYLVLILAFSALLIVRGEVPDFTPGGVLNWLTFNVSAERADMFFPMGQAWFLHALFFITLLSPLFFTLANISRHYFLVPIMISLILSILQLTSGIAEHLNLLSHNFYSPLSNLGFFMFGAYYFSMKAFFSKRLTWLLFLGTLLLSYSLGINIELKGGLEPHIVFPDIFYVLCSYSAIFFFLVFQSPITFINNKTPFLNAFFLFMSQHSFSVFLLHSLVLSVVHQYMGSVSGEPVKALIKIALVISITCLLAIPFSSITTRVKSRILLLIF